MKKILKKDDQWLLPMIESFLNKRPTYGYRRVTALVRRELKGIGKSVVNHKRIYRIMKANNLLLAPYGNRPLRTHDGKVETIRSNIRWCSDAFGILCWNGEQLQVAFSLDCHDREVMSWVSSSRGIGGELVRDLMAETVEKRFGKVLKIPQCIQWLSDNGPGYIARQTVAFGRDLGLDIRTTPTYSPESNGMAEAFVKTFKRDYVYVNDLSTADRVRQQLPQWFEDYNENAPHKALKMNAPRQYRRQSV